MDEEKRGDGGIIGACGRIFLSVTPKIDTHYHPFKAIILLYLEPLFSERIGALPLPKASRGSQNSFVLQFQVDCRRLGL